MTGEALLHVDIGVGRTFVATRARDVAGGVTVGKESMSGRSISRRDGGGTAQRRKGDEEARSREEKLFHFRVLSIELRLRKRSP